MSDEEPRGGTGTRAWFTGCRNRQTVSRSRRVAYSFNGTLIGAELQHACFNLRIGHADAARRS